MAYIIQGLLNNKSIQFQMSKTIKQFMITIENFSFKYYI